MPGFNTSTRKEDISLRLRAQNLKNARDQTKRLEEDNRKMEERLKELKTAMRREKEQRERQGAGFWGRGQPNTGSLTNYASEVLQNKVVIPPLEGKIKKVKILRDEPLDKPKQIGLPGTMKYIAQRKLTTGATPRDKQKGPKCGQCEDRAATLSCVQCSEIYCPGCFAAFHLKGALKQHRSVPLSAAGPRVCMSPSTSTDSQNARGGQASGLIPTQTYNESDVNGSEAAGACSVQSSTKISNTTAPTLLQGDYDESQSAASFQAALMAWRQGEQPKALHSSRHSPEKQIASLAVAVDQSIGTSEETRVPDIVFKSTLSYAEKLMVKKHLRMKLAEVSPEIDMQSQRSFNQPVVSPQSSEEILRSASQLHSPGSFSRGSTVTDSNEEDHIDFQSLFEAVTLSKSPDRLSTRSAPARPDISISELFPQEPSASEIPNLKSSTAYVVKEVSPLESWKTEHLQQSDAFDCTFHGDMHSRIGPQHTNMFHHVHMEANSELYNPAKSTPDVSSSPQDQSPKSCLAISELVDNEGELSSKSQSWKQNNEPSEHQYMDEVSDLENTQSPPTLEMNSSKLPSRPKSAKPRSRTAISKLSKSSQAASRAGYEGHLTKVPSDALRIVAHLVQSPEYLYTTQSPLEGFFLAGVERKQPTQIEDGVITPFKGHNKAPRPKSRSEGVKSARQEKETVKISNKLYQMAPRSWHPDNSLSSTVPLTEVKLDGQGGEMILSYSHSQGIDWHQSSSHNIKETPGGAISPNPVLVFGDEMFIAEAAAAAPLSQVASVQKSSKHGQRDIVSETSKSDNQPLFSCQTPKKTGGRRFHNVTTPVGKSDICKGLTIMPVPPDSRQGHKLSSEVSSSFPTKSKQKHRAPDDDQKGLKPLEQSTKKSQASKDEDNFRLSRNSSRSPKTANSLKNSTSLKSGSQRSKMEHNQSQVKADTSSSKGDQAKAASQNMQSSKTEVSLQKHGQNCLRRDFNNVLSNNYKSDPKPEKRPNSSVTQPTHSDGQKFQKSTSELRPNSSSGGTEPLRKSQQCPNPSADDTVVSDMMKSRVQADGWVDDECDFSYDYDDGDNLNPASLRMQPISMMPKPHNRSSEHWETEVRPFSGRSIGSKTGRSQSKVMSAKGDYKKTSTPISGRSTSAASQKSGRISRAIMIDGDDLSCYDSLGVSDERDVDDEQTLDQLEWELASNTGRLTADGKISRMSILDSDDVVSSPSMMRSLRRSSEKHYDIAAKLLEDENQAARSVENVEVRRNVTVDEVDEVRALS